MACQGCAKQTSKQELNMSGAGQWLCRSCLAQYEVQLATRRQRAAQVYRLCRCGATLSPRDEMDVPLYLEGSSSNRRKSLNLEYAFRRSVYECSCGERFTLKHPVIWLLPVVIASIAALVGPQNLRGSVVTCLIAVGLFATLALPDVYFRLRFPALRRV